MTNIICIERAEYLVLKSAVSRLRDALIELDAEVNRIEFEERNILQIRDIMRGIINEVIDDK